ncbi:uncharacterized protein Z519_08174 [Cladophialophora bantiana CBS 173.52]|uniref:Arylsulfatase n=1 Tax=Cladophialophora bantiana (strain ATCC 10958 / CBS 173.52 / CDC B-1940 / NIH 8579) TaxID=1442370 RepID=A0A0D2HD83_CLAB1|nr:uncharacterized protein Z519_08174 [Cladophialophora bantiana CBS 173.52]KIW91278.1 hypothetical protein Z519_08174 [Cladophialophora bantiana CBS 173.52]
MCRSLFLFLLTLTFVPWSYAALKDRQAPSQKPNFVFIMTDDQDLHLDSMQYMPNVLDLIAKEGTTYQQHFCTVAQCCPSRVSLLTGKLAHNTNVTDIVPPYGGYPKFVQQGLNNNYLPVWLQQAGYNTYYTGKLMNAHSTANWNNPFPAGWNGTAFLIDPGTYNYYNATFQSNRDPPVSTPGQYNTDQVAQNALNMLDQAHAAGAPFFLGVTPIAPHCQTVFNPTTPIPGFLPPIPASRHQNLFPGVKIPRSPNFNPIVPSGASWITHLPQLNSTEIDYFDNFYRSRLQALQAVDEMISTIVDRLNQYSLLENTYVIYTTDNGYHMGNHRMQPGKYCAYEEDINIPFYIRGPGVPRGKTVDFVTTHTDIAPTLFQLAGIPLRSDFDGSPMPVTDDAQEQRRNAPALDHTMVEYWGTGGFEGAYGLQGINGSFTQFLNNTYKSMRIVTSKYNLQYTAWCTNEHELYDMTRDPSQMNNLLGPSASVNATPFASPLNRPLSQVQPRLDALLMVLKSCKANQCTQPWRVLHPDDDVHNLVDALNGQYDAFYTEQPKVEFEKCELGYLIQSEGPQTPNYYGTNIAGWT